MYIICFAILNIFIQLFLSLVKKLYDCNIDFFSSSGLPILLILQFLLKYANKYKPPRHNTKFTNEYYLNHILNVLSEVISWKDLMSIKTIKNSNTYHFKTISKTHIEWARNGVYKRAYNQTLEDENIKITDNNFIDGTLIINKSGVECIGYGCGESF